MKITDADLRFVATVLARFPGAQIVDVRPPAIHPPAHSGSTTWGDMIEAQRSAALEDRAEADRLRETQAQLVEAGALLEPDAGKLQAAASLEARASCFDAIERLVNRCRDDGVILERLRTLREQESAEIAAATRRAREIEGRGADQQ